MRVDNGEFFALSGTGAAVWRLIDGHRDRYALLRTLAIEFATDQEEITDDVDALLAQLRSSGLLARG